MASLHVRNVDDEIVALLKERATRHGRSAEAEHREILQDVLKGRQAMSFDEMAALLRQRLTGRPHTPSEILQREGRDER